MIKLLKQWNSNYKEESKTNREREQVLSESTGRRESDNNVGMFYGYFLNRF